MSTPQPPEHPPPPRQSGGSHKPAKPPGASNVPWGLIAMGAVVAYAVIFVLLNDDQVEVSFVFFSAETSLVIALALAVALGFLLGFFADLVRTRRAKKRDAKKKVAAS